MNNYLPKNSKGFTLVELMIAIAIIAILAVVGLTIFNGVQANARDAARREDVIAIAKALEANKGTAETYPALEPSLFAAGRIPSDPTRSYCVNYKNTASAALDTAPATSWTNTTCAGVTNYTNVAGLNQPPAAQYKWRVCASLESGTNNIFCKANVQN